MTLNYYDLDDGDMSMDLFYLYTTTISLIPTSIGKISFTNEHKNLMRKLLNVNDYVAISRALDEWKKEHNYI